MFVTRGELFKTFKMDVLNNVTLLDSVWSNLSTSLVKLRIPSDFNTNIFNQWQRRRVGTTVFASTQFLHVTNPIFSSMWGKCVCFCIWFIYSSTTILTLFLLLTCSINIITRLGVLYWKYAHAIIMFVLFCWAEITWPTARCQALGGLRISNIQSTEQIFWYALPVVQHLIIFNILLL